MTTILFSAETTSEIKTEVWTFFGKPQIIITNEIESLILSKNCYIDDQYKKTIPCKALTAAQTAKFSNIKIKNTSGARPGMLVCSSLKGIIVPGFDTKHNQNSFCLFEDNSLISNGSLAHHAYKNDGLR